MKTYCCVSRCATKLSGKSAVTSLERSATRLVILMMMMMMMMMMTTMMTMMMMMMIDEKQVKCFDQVPRTECRSVPRNVCNPVFPIVQCLTHHHIITILIMILRMDKNQVCTPTYFCESCEQQAAQPFEVSPLLQTMNEQ